MIGKVPFTALPVSYRVSAAPLGMNRPRRRCLLAWAFLPIIAAEVPNVKQLKQLKQPKQLRSALEADKANIKGHKDRARLALVQGGSSGADCLQVLGTGLDLSHSDVTGSIFRRTD